MSCAPPKNTELRIGYADLETTNPLDVESDGSKLFLDGNELKRLGPDGIVYTPEVFVKVAAGVADAPDLKGYVGDLAGMLDWFYSLRLDRVYFHNLRFDDSYIGSYLQHPQTLPSGVKVESIARLMDVRGQVFEDWLIYYDRDETHSCRLWDSAKIFSRSLAKLGRDFGLLKQENEAMRVGCDLRMRAYCLRDCMVLRNVMRRYFDIVSEATDGRRPYGWMTAASTSYHLAMDWAAERYGKSVVEKMYPPCREDLGFPWWLREGYKGATPLLDPAIKGKPLHDVHVYDVNSMYPFHMMYSKLPGGYPRSVNSLDDALALEDKGWLWIAYIHLQADVKPGHRATYLLKQKNENDELLAGHIDDITTGGRQIIDCVTFKTLQRDYENIDVEWVAGVAFRANVGFLNGYLDGWYARKSDAHDPSMRAFSKMILNSLYGKFGTDPVHRGTEYDYDEKGVIKIKDSDRIEEDERPLYLPVAIFATAYARDMISRACNAVGWDHVAYTDTDSIHVHGLQPDEIERRLESEGFRIDAHEVGAWDHESRWDDALYIRNKGYFHFNADGSKEIKMAGANRFYHMDCLDDVLKPELTGYRNSSYRVKGGILIFETPTSLDSDPIVSHRVRRGMTIQESLDKERMIRREARQWASEMTGIIR